ncbi:MAG: hypothetical protein ACRDEA_13010, partial [Microcystaceae cyanobacterium]
MIKEKNNTAFLHPLGGSSFLHWINVALQNGGVEQKYLLKALSVSVASIGGIPFRIFEKAK